VYKTRNDTDREKQAYSRKKTRLSDTLHSINPVWIGVVENPNLPDEKQKG
jgi:hypothetical protein